jgi:hypothetical protein
MDADVDNARNFAAQKFLYGQALKANAWLAGQEIVPVTSFWDKLIDRPYFTDGYLVALWLSGTPVSMFDIDIQTWDEPPKWMKR